MFSVLIFKPEDGGSMFLRNVGIYVHVHAALQPRIPTLTSLKHWYLPTSLHGVQLRKTAYVFLVDFVNDRM
jgi:hypothetical protein